MVLQYVTVGTFILFSLISFCPSADPKPSLEMENEEKIRLEARRRLEEQLKQYRVQRHKERVSNLFTSVVILFLFQLWHYVNNTLFWCCVHTVLSLCLICNIVHFKMGNLVVQAGSTIVYVFCVCF